MTAGRAAPPRQVQLPPTLAKALKEAASARSEEAKNKASQVSRCVSLFHVQSQVSCLPSAFSH